MDPASDFNMLIFLHALKPVSLACWLKVCMVSKVTPRSLGSFSRETWRFLILIWGWILASWELGVKRVTVDFSGETNIVCYFINIVADANIDMEVMDFPNE